ncbi:palmitoyl-monogalactosyldiacylglycerol delta-7 desaturase, chloroplastic-like [Silene latifolia]|uniref:palmitoyl-monogalactosyldiacylglycerol delta-7 desaturase, chloroplastic-like n=1 Tax=Silene latifolia TaxID=37657 RepID=UPI003D7884E9
MALIASTSNINLNQSSILPSSHTKSLSTIPCIKPKLPNPKYNILTRKNVLINKYAHFSNPHDKKRCQTTMYSTPMGDATITTPESSDSSSNRIWWSNVVVKRPNNLFKDRKWNALDIGTLSMVIMMHGLAMFAPFAFNWGAFWVAVSLYLVTGLLGICLSFHRQLSHNSFKLPKWLEYLFAYFGVLALQGNPIDWVSTHRYHHQFCDSDKDPHSPFEGFWFSHMNWLFDTKAIVRKCGEPKNVGDLERQPFYRFIRSTYILHPLALGLILYALGGFPYIVWGMGVRTVWVYHITWLVNSACHVWGNQAWNTRDLSTNNWWVALVSFGEGWHNNHHAFEYSARHGLEWWEVDMTWYTIRLFQALGLAKDVKLPTEAHKQRMTFKSQGIED